MSSDHKRSGKVRHVHPLIDRVIYVKDIPTSVPWSQLLDMFEIVLGKGSVAFGNYPIDTDSTSSPPEHKGYAFVLLSRQEDVKYCVAKYMRADWFLEGTPGLNGFDENGRAYVMLHNAYIKSPPNDVEDKHLVFCTSRDCQEVGMRDFKAWVLGIVDKIHPDYVMMRSESSGPYKYIHLHTEDVESASVLRLLCHLYAEDGLQITAKFAPRKPTDVKNNETIVFSPTVLIQAKTPPKAEKSLVIEPITENYGKFGIPYKEAIRSTTS